MKPLTHIKMQQHRAEQIKQEILILLEWTEEQYQKFRRKVGCAYLQAYMSKQPAIVDQLVSTPIFWKWFDNGLVIRDEVFVGSNMTECSLIRRRMIYEKLLQPDALVEDMKINAVVMREINPDNL